MKNEAKYLENTYLFEFASTIKEITQDGNLTKVYLNETIFYPQGGGQPSDTGIMEIAGKEYNVFFVEYLNGKIAHHISDSDISENFIDKDVLLHIDKERRIINAKSHTAGHLITHVLESINIELLPMKGHHFPSESYIEMLDEKRQGNSELMKPLEEGLLAAINSELDIISSDASFDEVEVIRPYLAKFIPQDKQTRLATIGGFVSVPCGGTHIKNTSELKGLKIDRIKRKKDRLKVNYSFSEF